MFVIVLLVGLMLLFFGIGFVIHNDRVVGFLFVGLAGFIIGLHIGNFGMLFGPIICIIGTIALKVTLPKSA